MKITRNTKVRLTANPDEDYKFKQWNNGITANPYITTVSNIISYRNKLAAIFELNHIPSGSSSGSGEDPIEPIEPIVPSDTNCPVDEIWYTTETDEVIPLESIVTEGWGANIISNTYENGKGVIKFDNDVLYCPSNAMPQKGLKTLILPNNLLYIGNDAFMNNSGLVFVKLPNNLVELRAGCFKGCTSLLKIDIPDNVTKIENWVFFNCPHLTDVIIGEKVSTIGYQVFCACNNLSSITIKNKTVPTITRTYLNVKTAASTSTNYYTNALNAGYKQYNELTHTSVNRLCPIYVPAESLENYKNSDWNQYWSKWVFNYSYTVQQRNILPITNNNE